MYVLDPEKTLTFHCVRLFCCLQQFLTPRLARSDLVLRRESVGMPNSSSESSIVDTLKWSDFLKQFDCTTTESTTDLPRVVTTLKLSISCDNPPFGVTISQSLRKSTNWLPLKLITASIHSLWGIGQYIIPKMSFKVPILALKWPQIVIISSFTRKCKIFASKYQKFVRPVTPT